MLVKLLIYSQTSTAGPLKVENGWIILSHTLLGTWLLVHAVIKVNPLQWRGATGEWISSTAYWPQFIPDYWFCWIIIHVSPIKDIVISRIGNGHSATHPKLSGPDCIQEESCLLLCFIFPSPPKFRVAGLCEGNSPVTGEFPAQRASNAENVPIWWRHHGLHRFITG